MKQEAEKFGFVHKSCKKKKNKPNKIFFSVLEKKNNFAVELDKTTLKTVILPHHRAASHHRIFAFRLILES